MNLNQQLEDKKKGCGRKFISGENEYTCGDRWYLHPIKGDVYDILTNYCDDCKSNIAILEQAIAEMQKQRQEILEIIDDFEEEVNKSEVRTTEEKKVIFVELKLLRIKLQLNQPKTEQ